MFNKKIKIYSINDKLDIINNIELGTEEIIQSFFSTICYNLENNKWGSVYPIIMNEFYKGKLEPENVEKAIKEINDIKSKLRELPLSKIKSFISIDSITLDDWFVNNQNNERELITDIILNALKIHNSKKYHFI